MHDLACAGKNERDGECAARVAAQQQARLFIPAPATRSRKPRGFRASRSGVMTIRPSAERASRATAGRRRWRQAGGWDAVHSGSAQVVQMERAELVKKIRSKLREGLVEAIYPDDARHPLFHVTVAANYAGRATNRFSKTASRLFT